MKISLLHPSRGRPDKSAINTSDWLFRSGDVEVEVLVSVDLSDPLRGRYQRLYGKDCYEFPSTCVVEATNSIAVKATGDILVYLSDDFKCPDNWGEILVKEFENENRPLLLKVDDCLQKFQTAIVTIPIMNRLLYQKLGYFWHPEYKSMHVDEDIYWTALKAGALKNCPHLKFPHHHYSNPDDTIRAERDETYKRSEAHWDQGKSLLKRRRAQGFPI